MLATQRTSKTEHARLKNTQKKNKKQFKDKYAQEI